MSGFDGQIEAVRAELVEYDREVFGMMAAKALHVIDHLTKANEELRAEVADLRGALAVVREDRDQYRGKFISQRGLVKDHDATIDRLTKERDWACERLDAMTTEVANRDERLSVMQEAIDEAVSRADLGTVVGRVITEPLRNLTKPEPEVDPLVGEVTVSILNRGERVVSLPELARLINGGARIAALAARGYEIKRSISDDV